MRSNNLLFGVDPRKSVVVGKTQSIAKPIEHIGVDPRKSVVVKKTQSIAKPIEHNIIVATSELLF